MAARRRILTRISDLEAFDKPISNFHEQIPSSMLYTMLPALIRNRIPRLHSIRQTVSDLKGRNSHVRSISAPAMGSIPETPPLSSYGSRQGSIAPNRDSMLSTDTTVVDFELQEDTTTYERPTSSGSNVPLFTLSEDKSGVNWKYANQGTTQHWICGLGVAELTFRRTKSHFTSLSRVSLSSTRRPRQSPSF